MIKKKQEIMICSATCIRKDVLFVLMMLDATLAVFLCSCILVLHHVSAPGDVSFVAKKLKSEKIIFFRLDTIGPLTPDVRRENCEGMT